MNFAQLVDHFIIPITILFVYPFFSRSYVFLQKEVESEDMKRNMSRTIFVVSLFVAVFTKFFFLETLPGFFNSYSGFILSIFLAGITYMILYIFWSIYVWVMGKCLAI